MLLLEPGTLIFDGDCSFCTSAANFVVRHSKLRITALAWQRTELDKYRLSKLEASDQVYLNYRGKNYGGHLCVAKLLQIQPSTFLRLLGTLMFLPPFRQISAAGYRVIAKNRHWLPGGTPACKVDE